MCVCVCMCLVRFIFAKKTEINKDKENIFLLRIYILYGVENFLWQQREIERMTEGPYFYHLFMLLFNTRGTSFSLPITKLKE